jgi:hypothetical protein
MATYDEVAKENSSTQVSQDLLSQIKEHTSFTDNAVDKGIINKEKGSSIVIRANGDITISPSLMTQAKYTANGHAIEQSIESDTITVRKRIDANEIIINDHKLNPALYELSDMRQMFNLETSAIGNLTMGCTVLVKAWEPTLKKWVLIRRPARIPMFSPVLNLSDAPDQLDINSDISDEILKMSKGGKKD